MVNSLISLEILFLNIFQYSFSLRFFVEGFLFTKNCFDIDVVVFLSYIVVHLHSVVRGKLFLQEEISNGISF